MRITAELLSQVEQRTNPLDQRELVLREYGIPAIENMGAVAITRGGDPSLFGGNNNAGDPFDSWDLSNNRLSKLDNFPRLSRLTNLYCAGNVIETIDAKNISKNVPNLTSLMLSYNAISSMAEILNIAKACPKLEVLALTGNPVTKRQHYRLFTIHQIPTLKVLDFAKVKPSERDRAERLAQSAAGAALASDVQAEASQRNNAAAVASKTFVPGEGDNEGRSFVTVSFTAQQKEQIRQLLLNASSAREVEEIEAAVRRGVLPVALQQQQQDEGSEKKRPLEEVPKLAPESEDSGPTQSTEESEVVALKKLKKE